MTTDPATFTRTVAAMVAENDRVPEQRQSEDQRLYAVLFNDVTHAPLDTWLHLGERRALADYLWEQGWRREVRPEDITERKRA